MLVVEPLFSSGSVAAVAPTDASLRVSPGLRVSTWNDWECAYDAPSAPWRGVLWSFIGKDGVFPELANGIRKVLNPSGKRVVCSESRRRVPVCEERFLCRLSDLEVV